MAITVRRYPQPYVEDIRVGTELPGKSVTFDVMKMALFASASGDFFPSHYDNKWATERSGHRAAIAHGLHLSCHLSAVVTNWIGPMGMMKCFTTENRGLTHDGDTITMHGKVRKIELAGKEASVEIELKGVKQDGSEVIRGTATVILPSRG